MVFWFIIEHTMLPIFFLVVLGYFLDKKFHLDVKTLSKLMFFLVIPSFIFTNIYTTQFPATSINIIAAIAVFMVICFIIANIVAASAITTQPCWNHAATPSCSTTRATSASP